MSLLPLPVFIPNYRSQDDPGIWSGHLAFLHDLLTALRPSRFVEVETAAADSYFAACQTILQEGLSSVCYRVFSDDVDALKRESLTAHNAAHYAAFSYLIDSGQASENFSTESIDVLHVSSNEAFNAWLPKLKPGGFALISGIARRDGQSNSWLLWEQLETRFSERFAFQHANGLGVVRKSGGAPFESPLFDALFGGSAETGEYLRRHYLIYNGYLSSLLQTGDVTQGLNRKIDELLTEVRAAQHERMILEVELRQTQFDRNDARRTLALTEAAAAAAKAASEAREVELQNEVQRLLGLLQSERDVIHALMNSLSWRVTAPLRAISELRRT